MCLSYRISHISGVLLLVLMIAGCSGDDDATPTGPETRIPVTVQYTDGQEYVGNPVYSPNGIWILYESEIDGNRDIWMRQATNGDPVRLTTHSGVDSAPCWSADGTLVYFESERSGRKKIWVVTAAENAVAERVTTTGDDIDEGSAACSVTGDLAIEYSSPANDGTNIYLISAGETTPTALTDTDNWIINRTPDWAPDGSQIVFESTSSGLSALWIMDADGSNLEQLTGDPHYEGHPAWSPDGQEIAFESRRTGYMEIFVISADGGDPMRVTLNGGYWPEYSADGTKMVYCLFGADDAEMWVMDVDW